MAQNIEILIRVLVSLFLATLVSSLVIKLIIKKEKEKHLGQAIREDIVKTHQLKSGTPTMGGVGILIGAVTSFFINYKFINIKTIIVLLLVSAFFMIGLIDDLIKVKFKDAKGLDAKIRFLLEIALTLVSLVLLGYYEQTMWHLHFFNNYIYLGILFIPFVVLMIVGSANGVNMTDGLDGLAGGLLLLAFLPFLLIALNNQDFALAFLITGFIGGNIGFLRYNANPAKIFMGDAGSLTNGSFLAMIAFLLNAEYLLLIAGGIFVVETISVILQVSYYKATRKRIFKMAPLHHHFEMLGMKEYQVVNLFYLFGFICSFIALVIGGII